METARWGLRIWGSCSANGDDRGEPSGEASDEASGESSNEASNEASRRPVRTLGLHAPGAKEKRQIGGSHVTAAIEVRRAAGSPGS